VRESLSTLCGVRFKRTRPNSAEETWLPATTITNILFPLDSPRLTGHRGLSAVEYGVAAIRDVPMLADLVALWEGLANAPFKGITPDGVLRQGLYTLADEGAPVAAMCKAANALLAGLSDGERAKLQYPIGAPEARAAVEQSRIPDQSQWPAAGRCFDLSPGRHHGGPARQHEPRRLREGARVHADQQVPGSSLRHAHHHERVELQFPALRGPSATGPWGWSLYGHHLALNCFALGGQMVISPHLHGRGAQRHRCGRACRPGVVRR